MINYFDGIEYTGILVALSVCLRGHTTLLNTEKR